MKNPGYIDLTISVSNLAKPWLAQHYPVALTLTPQDMITEKLYWIAQTEKLALSVSDRRPHVKFVEPMTIEIDGFHGSRWNKFSAKAELQLFNYVETRLWMIFVETLIRTDLYNRMHNLGITKRYEDFMHQYHYDDTLDYEREVRTYSNHRRSGELHKWLNFKLTKEA